MIGILSEEQIRHVLNTQLVGRIGCYANREIYVIPITYTYHENCIYAHSREGHKVRLMRKNPAVCLPVDSIETMYHWRSVIVWGEYQELSSEQARVKLSSLHLHPTMVENELSELGFINIEFTGRQPISGHRGPTLFVLLQRHSIRDG